MKNFFKNKKIKKRDEYPENILTIKEKIQIKSLKI